MKKYHIPEILMGLIILTGLSFFGYLTWQKTFILDSVTAREELERSDLKVERTSIDKEGLKVGYRIRIKGDTTYYDLTTIDGKVYLMAYGNEKTNQRNEVKKVYDKQFIYFKINDENTHTALEENE